MARKFIYDGRSFPDPDPNLTVEEVRQYLATFMPELSNADTKTTKDNEDDVYTFNKRVGTKGTKQIIGGKLYDTETATRIASDRYWDGHNFERHGRNSYLYKTKRGNFFVYSTSQWQGETANIRAVTPEEAKEYYESLREHEVEYEVAFGVKPEEA